MQACGMLATRLASHALAACSSAAPAVAGLAGAASWRTVSTSSAAGEASPSGAAAVPTLTAAQRQQLPKLLSSLQRPGAAAQRLGALASLSVSYRDLSVLLTALRAREAGGDPLASDLPVSASKEASAGKLDDLGSSYAAEGGSAAAAAAAAAGAPSAAGAAAGGSAAKGPLRGTYLPLKDVTLIPDDKQVDGLSPAPQDARRFSPAHMDKISCWAATQPNHIEVSHQLMTGVNLFPPSEATYPTYVDFDAAMRLLDHHRSRKRMRFQRRLGRKQDKYQLKTWEHKPGEV